MEKAKPHVWNISSRALLDLKEYEKNQAICINGESGAGKTVSTKMCLKYITSLSVSDE